MTYINLLALDQSTKLTGWSLWSDGELKEHGVLKVSRNYDSYIERMQEMYFLIKRLFDEVNPDFVVLENVQYQSNCGTYKQLAQLQGVIIALLYERDMGFYIIEPTKWRKVCGVTGRKRVEQKASAIQIVQDEFKIEVSEDEAEAILIGKWAKTTIIKGEEKI